MPHIPPPPSHRPPQTVLGDLAGKSMPVHHGVEVNKVKDFIDKYFIKIGVGHGNNPLPAPFRPAPFHTSVLTPLLGNGFFTFAFNLCGLEWLYLSCLKGGEGFITIRVYGFMTWFWETA